MSGAAPSLTGLLPSALAALGAAGCADTLGLGAELAEVRQIALLLVDGLGYHLLPEAARTTPLFDDLRNGTTGRLRELASTFPSTTPTSLVSLGTGQLPGAHGVLGFTVNVPGTDEVLTHIVWRDDPPPRLWQPTPRLLEQAARGGLTTAVVAPAPFAGSGLTDAAYGEARYVGRKPGRATAAGIVRELRAGTQLVYGYHAAVDTAAHVHGIASPQWQEAARDAGSLITRIAERLPAGSALLVTADHGGLDIAPPDRIDIDGDARLTDGVRVVAGEPRVRYLHVQDGAAEDVVAAWRGVLGDRATVRTRDEVIEAGLFGPVSAAHRARIGDVVVVCTEPIALFATAHEPQAVAKLVGMHGALTPIETSIPLIVIRR